VQKQRFIFLFLFYLKYRVTHIIEHCIFDIILYCCEHGLINYALIIYIQATLYSFYKVVMRHFVIFAPLGIFFTPLCIFFLRHFVIFKLRHFVISDSILYGEHSFFIRNIFIRNMKLKFYKC